MRAMFKEAIHAMEIGFRRLENQVPKPVPTIISDSEALRYVEKTVHQALVQKLARYISGLNAIDVLLSAGYVQEQAVIQRTLDEIDEDITFLALGIDKGLTPLHERYLDAFWQEEFDDGVAPIDNTKRRDQIRRRKIRAAIEHEIGAPPGSAGEKAGSVISQTYSGFVHAASPFIMEMCGGDDLRFFTSGLRDTPRIVEHVDDFWNYIYRGLLAVIMVAKVFGDAELTGSMYLYLDRFEKASNSTYISDVRSGINPAAL